MLFLLVFITTFVSAADTVAYTYKVSNEINVKNPCFNNGTYFSSGATCNITIFDTLNALIVNDQGMTNQLNFFNYTMDNGNVTWPQGRYRATMVCLDGGKGGSQTFLFDINSNGQSTNTNLTIFIVLALASVLILLAALLVENEYLGFISGALFVVTGLFVIIYGIGNWSNMYTDAVGWVTLGLGLLFLLAAAYGAISSNKTVFAGGDFEDSLDADVWGRP